MSNLIKRFTEDLQLAGYAKRSTPSYVSSVLRLQRFYNKQLEDITEEDLRQYWLWEKDTLLINSISFRQLIVMVMRNGLASFYCKSNPWNAHFQISGHICQ